MNRLALTRACRALFAFVALALVVLLFARRAAAAPEAHVLRIDPRAGVDTGKPILSTVVEVVQFKRLSDLQQQCQEGNAEKAATCLSDKLEQPKSLFSAIAVPEGSPQLLVNINGEDTLTTFVDKVQWGQAKNQPNVGTAWLVALDASSGMGSHYGDAERVAYSFIDAMQANDLMDLMIFDDRNVIKDTKWITYKDRNKLVEMLKSQPGTAASHGSNRALFTQVKQMTADAFGSLGNIGAPENVPMHQAMVVLSDGAGRGDAESASPSADVFHQYLDNGRLGDNTAAPKTPLPVVSVLFPSSGGFLGDFYKNNDTQFMMALANPEIGGFFDIVQSGQGDAKGKLIVARVRERFDAMWLMHFKLSCLATSLTQTFKLVVGNTTPTVLPDSSFKDVPIGVDPTQWPLNVDFDKTIKEAQANPVYPGGTFKVYGDFCWSGDKGRAESYFIPAGTKPPASTNSRDPAQAKKAQQQLIAQNMRGQAIDVGDTFATFQVPDDEKILEGSGDNMVARVLIYDNKAKRASAIDAKTILSLKASKKPLNVLLFAGIGGVVIVIILLAMLLMKGGGKQRGGAPPPAAPPPGYGAAPPYGGAPPPGGGYQMQNNASPDAYASTYGPPPTPATPAGNAPPAYVPPATPPAAPALAFGQPAYAGGPPINVAQNPLFSAQEQPISQAPPTPHDALGIVQVRCPACGMTTMATPGQRSVCFSCGQPLPADIAKGGGGGNAPAFPLTGAMSQAALTPPPNPYGAASAASIVGNAGQFTIRPGAEVRVGRDPAQCPIFLAEPRVSGVHASLKFENGQLHVRDEASNNGTQVAGARIAAGVWTVVPQGAQLRFGPIEFTVRHEA